MPLAPSPSHVDLVVGVPFGAFWAPYDANISSITGLPPGISQDYTGSTIPGGIPHGTLYEHNYISGIPTMPGLYTAIFHADIYGTGTVTFSVTGGTQTIAAFGAIGTQIAGESLTITPPVASSGLTVILSVLSGPATLSGNTLTFTGAGTVILAADQPGNTYYNAAPEVQVSISIVTPSVALSGLLLPYTGAPQAATVTTTPGGLATSVTYSGTGGTTYAASSTPPTAIGTYTVLATITDSSAPSGITATGTLTIVNSITGSPVLIPTLNISLALTTMVVTLTPAPLAAKLADDLYFLIRMLDGTSTPVNPVSSGLQMVLREFPGREVILSTDGYTDGTDTASAPFYLLHLSAAALTAVVAALADNYAPTGSTAKLYGQLLWNEVNPYSCGPASLTQQSPVFELDLTRNLQ